MYSFSLYDIYKHTVQVLSHNGWFSVTIIFNDHIKVIRQLTDCLHTDRLLKLDFVSNNVLGGGENG